MSSNDTEDWPEPGDYTGDFEWDWKYLGAGFLIWVILVAAVWVIAPDRFQSAVDSIPPMAAVGVHFFMPGVLAAILKVGYEGSL